MTRSEGACCQGHGHRTEKRREQGHEVQEFFGAIERLAHLGTPGLEGLQAHTTQIARLDLFLRPVGVACHGRIRARHREPVIEAAGRLHQPGRDQIRLGHHHARRKTHEARTTIRLGHQHLGDAQRGIPQQERIAHPQLQGIEQGPIDPDLT